MLTPDAHAWFGGGAWDGARDRDLHLVETAADGSVLRSWAWTGPVSMSMLDFTVRDDGDVVMSANDSTPTSASSSFVARMAPDGTTRWLERFLPSHPIAWERFIPDAGGSGLVVLGRRGANPCMLVMPFDEDTGAPGTIVANGENFNTARWDEA